MTVHVDAATQFERGSVADLVAGASIEVKGRLISGSSDVLATRIKFEDD